MAPTDVEARPLGRIVPFDGAFAWVCSACSRVAFDHPTPDDAELALRDHARTVHP